MHWKREEKAYSYGVSVANLAVSRDDKHHLRPSNITERKRQVGISARKESKGKIGEAKARCSRLTGFLHGSTLG